MGAAGTKCCCEEDKTAWGVAPIVDEGPVWMQPIERPSIVHSEFLGNRKSAAVMEEIGQACHQKMH
eukprot:448202-Amphidinium_carterae.1